MTSNPQVFLELAQPGRFSIFLPATRPGCHEVVNSSLTEIGVGSYTDDFLTPAFLSMNNGLLSVSYSTSGPIFDFVPELEIGADDLTICDIDF